LIPDIELSAVNSTTDLKEKNFSGAKGCSQTLSSIQQHVWMYWGWGEDIFQASYGS